MQFFEFIKSAILPVSDLAFCYYVRASTEPATDRTFDDGDVYVWLAPNESEHTISVYHNSSWVQWNPAAPIKIMLFFDTPVYPAPSGTEGLRYVASEDEFHEASKGVPTDISTLVALIVKDGKRIHPVRPRDDGDSDTEPTQESRVKGQMNVDTEEQLEVEKQLDPENGRCAACCATLSSFQSENTESDIQIIVVPSGASNLLLSCLG